MPIQLVNPAIMYEFLSSAARKLRGEFPFIIKKTVRRTNAEKNFIVNPTSIGTPSDRPNFPRKAPVPMKSIAPRGKK